MKVPSSLYLCDRKKEVQRIVGKENGELEGRI
jgi:hypothetical protein